jgi:hypothetical protein
MATLSTREAGVVGNSGARGQCLARQGLSLVVSLTELMVPSMTTKSEKPHFWRVVT